MTRRSAPQGASAVAATANRDQGTSRLGHSTGTRYGLAGLEARVNNVLAAPESTRRTTLWAAAFRAGALAAAGELDADFARSRLLVAAQSRNIPDAVRQVRKGMTKGLLHPHDPYRGGVNIETQAEARALIFEWFEALDAKGAPARICTTIGRHCWNVGSTTVNLSYREIAEAGGVNLATVSKCANSGRLARHVSIVTRGQRLRTTGSRTTWRLVLRSVPTGNRPKAISSGYGGLLPHGTGPEHDPRDPDVDAWWSWASGWAVYCALDLDEPSTVPELVARSGYTRSTVYRNLARLRDQYGMAVDGEAGWRRVEVEVDDWDFVRKAEKAARYKADRERHRAALESRFAARSEVAP